MYSCVGRDIPKVLHEDYFQKKLEYKPNFASAFQKKPNVMAFDTETYENNGNLLTLCLSNGLHAEFKNDELNFDKIFNFFQPYVRSDVLFFAWNLGFDAMVLLKHLGDDIIKFKEAEFMEFKFKNYKISYMTKKCLTISDDSKHTLTFYDVASLYGKMKLDDAAKQFIGEQKEYDGLYQNKKFPADILNDKVQSDKVIQYCIKDSQLTAKLTNLWLEAFHNNFKMYPNRFHSAGTIAFQYIKTRVKNYPSFYTVPVNVQELAFKCYFGGRFEVFQRGTFKNVYHYDINSAYPYAMSIMPDFLNGEWIELNNLKDLTTEVLDKVGFYEIDVQVNSELIAPFLYRIVDKGNIYAPRGRFKTFTTSMELKQALLNYDIKIFNIKGFYFKPFHAQLNDFNIVTKEMYEARLKQKNESQKYVYKVLINSVYGKTAQTKPVPTQFFSPIVCAYITGVCRAMLLSACAQNPKEIISVATDAVFSKVPLKLDTPKVKELGKWSFEQHDNFTIFMSGVYSYDLKCHKCGMLDRKTQSRGFKIRCLKEDGTEYFLDLADHVITETKEGKYVLNIKYLLPNTISASIVSHNIKNIGKMENKEKEIDLNGDKKRIWEGYLKDLNTQQRSATYPINFLYRDV